jgi:hypothetical protein
MGLPGRATHAVALSLRGAKSRRAGTAISQPANSEMEPQGTPRTQRIDCNDQLALVNHGATEDVEGPNGPIRHIAIL